ncbi:bacterio-opsin activator domain-containing protein [Haladaptatus sp. DFWS20]|uniref:bacterio-opsin activator domain-containing protein n=1 Tax=Haladaptatus sp. DFWS20 TaxID=3403467 RepID=UPI003EBD57C0
MRGERNTEYLTTPEFEHLRRGTETYREDLVVTLAGRVGLRASELTRIRPADLREGDRAGGRSFLLTVPEGNGETREAYVLPEVAHDLRKFGAANDVSRCDPFIPVSSRRVQMLVSDVSDRVDGLQDITCRDLRKHFAWRCLVEEGIDPHVVQVVGGWKSLESLSPYLDTPTTTTIIDAFTSQQSSPDVRGAEHDTDHVDSHSSELLRCIGELGATLAEASTVEDVETIVCDHLTEVYRAVWICDMDGSPRESAIPMQADATVPGVVLDGIDASADGNNVTVLESVSVDGPLSRCAFAVAPLRSSETVHGLLCVADDSIRATDRTVLADIGRRVGRTITSITRKRLLLADTGVMLSLRSTDTGVFLVSVSNNLDCRFTLEGVVPIANHSLLYFVRASGASVGDVLEGVTATDAVTDARLVRDYEDDALFEFVVSGDSLATVLVERGGTVRDLSVEAGVLDVSGVFSQHVDVRHVVESVETSFPETDLYSKRKVSEPAQSAVSVQQTVHDHLTDRQWTALRAAYLAGYFEWPRGSTAEELAASMDVSSPTLHNHLRKAQQKVFDTVFDDIDHRSADTRRH